MLKETEPQIKTSHKKCEQCSGKMSCECVGQPTFNNKRKSEDGRTLTPVRCDNMLRQEEGPYIRS